jgi:N4-gp56 family major capsid protein
MEFNLQLFANTTIPANLVEKAWAKQLWKEAERENFFAKFTGEGQDNIIQVKTELKKEAGDQITIPLVMRLTGEGVTGDSTLEGNEEALQFYDCPVKVDQIRHAVRLQGAMEEQKTSINLRQSAKDGLKLWMTEKQEHMIVNALVANPTAGNVVYPDGRNAENAVAEGDVMTTALISKACRKAKTMTPKIRPVNVNGKKYYVMLVDNYQARDLKNDQKWLDAQYNCAERGIDNPIFSGMLGVYDGVVLHEYEHLPRTTTGASSAMVGHALLLGCQAGIKGVAKEATWKEKAFDYDNQMGFSTGAILGVAKAKFNEKDFAVIQVITSSAND